MDFPLDTALEVLDGLCNGLGAVGVERDNVMAYGDTAMIDLFKAYAALSGLFRDGQVLRGFVREHHDINGTTTTPAGLLFSGDPRRVLLCREWIEWLAGK